MIRLLAAPAAALLIGCVAGPTQRVSVPVPVECRVQMPVRPAMPTDSLEPGVEIDRFVASAAAELEIREGYEVELRAALDACTASLARS